MLIGKKLKTKKKIGHFFKKQSAASDKIYWRWGMFEAITSFNNCFINQKNKKTKTKICNFFKSLV